jgi:hypothetical protein
MPSRSRRSFGLSLTLGLVGLCPLWGAEKLHQPMPVEDPAPAVLPCPPECEPVVECPPCASRPQKIVVEMSQPEVRFVAPPRPCAPSEKGCGPAGKPVCSSFININRIRTKIFGAPGPGLGAAGAPRAVTSVIPAYATATIPIALQTTRYFAGAEYGVFGAGAARREAAGLSRAEIEEMVREAVRAESARRAEAAPKAEAGARDACAELKERVDRIEKRLGDLEQKLDATLKKIEKLP